MGEVSDIEQPLFGNEWKKLKKEEGEEMFTPLPEITQQLDDIFDEQLNFRFIFPEDSIGQDWVVSILE